MATTTATRSLAVDRREASFGVRVGDPLIVDVADRGSGWAIIAVGRSTYTVYRNGVDLDVPHDAVSFGR